MTLRAVVMVLATGLLCSSLAAGSREGDSLYLVELNEMNEKLLFHDYSQPLDNWYGVGVGATGRVDSLSIYNAFFNMTGFPDNLGALSNLVYLYVEGYGGMEEPLPESFNDLQNLVSLTLRGVQKENLPESVDGFPKLRELVLTSAGLSEVPSWIEESRELMTIDLSHNDISTLPGWLYECQYIANLNLRDNTFKTLPVDITSLPLSPEHPDGLELVQKLEVYTERNYLERALLHSETIAWLDSVDPDWESTQLKDVSNVISQKSIHSKKLHFGFTKNKLVIYDEAYQKGVFALYGLNGKLLVQRGFTDGVIHFESFLTGLYLLHIESKGGVSQFKISL